MNGIAPTGMKVKDGRVKHYGDVWMQGEVVVAGYKRAWLNSFSPIDVVLRYRL
jgi:hypothetical protein